MRDELVGDVALGGEGAHRVEKVVALVESEGDHLAGFEGDGELEEGLLRGGGLLGVAGDRLGDGDEAAGDLSLERGELGGREGVRRAELLSRDVHVLALVDAEIRADVADVHGDLDEGKGVLGGDRGGGGGVHILGQCGGAREGQRQGGEPRQSRHRSRRFARHRGARRDRHNNNAPRGGGFGGEPQGRAATDAIEREVASRESLAFRRARREDGPW